VKSLPQGVDVKMLACYRFNSEGEGIAALLQNAPGWVRHVAGPFLFSMGAAWKQTGEAGRSKVCDGCSRKKNSWLTTS
jgi:hypothetical protein